MALMEYQENLELYLNLSRKELQGLCKKNNLPANRSHTQLAKSLASFFKKKNARPSPSKEKSSSPVEISFYKSFVPDIKPKETANPSEGITGGSYEKRTNSSESDIYRLVSCIRQKGGDDRRHSQTRDQMEISRHMVGQASEKAYNIAADAVCPCIVNNESPEGLGGSTFRPGDIGLRSSVAADIHHITTVTRLGSECHDGGIKNKSRESPEVRNYGQKLLNHAATNSETCNLASIQPRAVDCSTETGFMLSEEISGKTIPSLQFFVMSEEGINLYVDLDSSPVEWINSLKDEVCINNKTQPHMSRILPNYRGFSDVDKHKISPYENIVMNLQGNGVEWNSGCTDSSFTSAVSGNFQSEAYLPDATVVSSGSSVLTSSSIPVEMSGCLDGNQAVSSSCVAHSKAQNHIAFDIVSCTGDGNVLPQDSTNASLRIEKSNASVFDISPKPISNMDVLCPEETINAETVECHTQKIAKVDSNNAVASDIRNFGNHTGSCLDSTQRGPMEWLLEIPGSVNRSSGSCQLGGQLVFDGPMTEVQLDPGSADHLLNQHACNPGSTVAQDLVSASNDDVGQNTPIKEKESSECSHSQNSLDKISKRSHSSEFHGELQSKRHHSNGEKWNGMMVNLRSTRTSAKETVSDQVVHPRRSTRLLSK